MKISNFSSRSRIKGRETDGTRPGFSVYSKVKQYGRATDRQRLTKIRYFYLKRKFVNLTNKGAKERINFCLPLLTNYLIGDYALVV